MHFGVYTLYYIKSKTQKMAAAAMRKEATVKSFIILVPDAHVQAAESEIARWKDVWKGIDSEEIMPEQARAIMMAYRKDPIFGKSDFNVE